MNEFQLKALFERLDLIIKLLKKRKLKRKPRKKSK